MDNQNKDKYLKKMLFTNDQIVEKCKELGKWVNEMYKDSNDLILVGLLKGSVPFLAELIKHINVEHEIDFMVVSSYAGGMESTTSLKVIMDLSRDIKGKDVLVVEDIVDSGLTLTQTTQRLNNMNPNSLKVITLLDKPSGRNVEFVPDKFGFKIENEFVYGFGLDVKEKLRNIPYIGVFDQEKFDEL